MYTEKNNKQKKLNMTRKQQRTLFLKPVK